MQGGGKGVGGGPISRKIALRNTWMAPKTWRYFIIFVGRGGRVGRKPVSRSRGPGFESHWRRFKSWQVRLPHFALVSQDASEKNGSRSQTNNESIGFFYLWAPFRLQYNVMTHAHDVII